jgi:Aerotolerance regulator N-terminal/von Willebrand factor type A domain
MGFFSPWFLGGLLAVGLPIWLHLLKRHKTDPKPFPSLMFFEHREQSSVMHRKLDHILLFVLRILMLLILALLFAQPFLRLLTAKGQGKKIIVVAVDNSASMRAASGTQTRLEKAKTDALSLVATIPAQQQAQVIALGGQVQALTQQVNDPGELRAAVASIPQTDGRSSFGELSRFLRTLSESTKTPLEVHFFSDLQKTGMPPFADLRLDPDTSIQFHNEGGAAPNWTVETVVAHKRVFDPKRFRIQATIAGYSTPAAKKNVSLILNGKTLQSKTVDVPENGRAQVEFLGLDASYGFNRCEIRIDSSDAMATDDHFYFSVERADPKKVLFVDDGRRPRAQLYFRAALDATTDAPFVMEVQSPDSAAAANLSTYAVVVLSDPGTLPSSLNDALSRYVSNGGAVFVALGPASAVLNRVPIADDAIDSTRYAGRDTERFLAVSDLDTGHPALKNVERFDGVKFYQVVRVTPSNSRVLAKLGDQTPLVLERQIGEGKALVFTSTFDNNSNDLPLHASWVPFVQQSVAYLGGGGPEEPVNVTTGSYVELRTADSQSAAAEVMDPDGKRALTLEEATKARTFALDREGYYEVKTANGRHSLMAVHTDRRESDLTPITKEVLDLWGATGGPQTGDAAAAGAQSADLRKPWSLAPYLLILLILVALAESIVADRYLRPAAQVDTVVKKEAA